MENASKALLIAGAILLAILIIAIGMYIYNSAQSTVNNSMTSMTTQELEAFNNQFSSYEGAQSGSNVKALIGRLIANSNTYQDESAKVPKVKYFKGAGGTNGQDNMAKSCTDGCVVDHADKAARANVDPTDGAALKSTDGNNNNYVKVLGQMRNGIVNKHEYYVNFIYDSAGMISVVCISYDED